MLRHSIAIVGIVVAVTLLGLDGRTARAQEEPAQYRTWIARAVGEYDAGRWNEARANFRRAHAVFPNARTLRGIGMTSFELAEYVEAIRNLTSALSETQRALTPEQRREVTELLERARTYTGRYRVRVEPSGLQSTLSVDGQPATLERDATLILDLGRREIVARADGHESSSRVVQVRGGEDEQLILTLRPTRPATPPTSTDPGATDSGTRTDVPPGDGRQPGDGELPDAISDEPRDGHDDEGEIVPPRRARDDSDDTSSGGSGVGVGLLITGGALAIGTGVSLVWMIGRGNALDRCGGVEGPCRNGATIESQQGLSTGVTIGLGLAAATAATIGIVLLSTSGGSSDDDDHRSRRRRTRLACVPAGSGVACSGVF